MLSAVHPEGLRIVAYRVADTFAGTALALVAVELWGRGGGAPARSRPGCGPARPRARTPQERGGTGEPAPRTRPGSRPPTVAGL